MGVCKVLRRPCRRASLDPSSESNLEVLGYDAFDWVSLCAGAGAGPNGRNLKFPRGRERRTVSEADAGKGERKETFKAQPRKDFGGEETRGRRSCLRRLRALMEQVQAAGHAEAEDKKKAKQKNKIIYANP